jgi:hypothetical protein
MAVLSLPLTFTNSFWTQDYHKGLQILYDKLEQVCTLSFAQFCPFGNNNMQGVAENEEIVTFVRVRISQQRFLPFRTYLTNF